MREEHLAYFKDLLEGRAEVSWHAWFDPREAELAAELPRAVFLRLKFHKLDEAETLLRAAGVPYTPDPGAARRERHDGSGIMRCWTPVCWTSGDGRARSSAARPTTGRSGS